MNYIIVICFVSKMMWYHHAAVMVVYFLDVLAIFSVNSDDYSDDKPINYFVTCLGFLVSLLIVIIVQSALSVIPVSNDISVPYTIAYLSGSHIICYLGVKFIGITLKKSDLLKFITNRLTCKNKQIFYILFIWAIISVITLTAILIPELSNSIVYSIVCAVTLILFIIFMQMFAIFDSNQRELDAKNIVIVQQDSYIKTIESLQSEIRNFNHDLHNIMSGASLQVQDGDLSGINEFLRSTANYLDTRIGQEIKQMTEIRKLQIPVLKSIIAVKMTEFKQQNRDINLEVITPVETINMDNNDLTRCLGILLDNAFEAITEIPDAEIDLLIIHEKSTLKIVVSNPCIDKPNIKSMYEVGYSTKGENRGVGLNSYKRIINRYSNITNRCYWRDGMIYQEMSINT